MEDEVAACPLSDDDAVPEPEDSLSDFLMKLLQDNACCEISFLQYLKLMQPTTAIIICVCVCRTYHSALPRRWRIDRFGSPKETRKQILPELLVWEIMGDVLEIYSEIWKCWRKAYQLTFSQQLFKCLSQIMLTKSKL
jgi:hypothetical protein